MLDDDLDAPLVHVTMLLADAAQVAEGKLFVLGGGISQLDSPAKPHAIALLLEVPWDRANIVHQWLIELLDEDGNPVLVNDRPLRVEGTFEAGRPAGAEPGSPLRVPMAIGFGGLPVAPGRRYVWQFAVDGTSEPDWRLRFGIPAPQPGPQPS